MPAQRIAFSTLGCPEWPWERILSVAAESGYDGIELRGIQQELRLDHLAPFLPANRAATLARMADLGLALACLDTSVSFHDPDQSAAKLDEGRIAIDLAASCGCPGIRIFGDQLPKGQDPAAVVERVAAGVAALSRHADGSGVQIWLETHGDFVHARHVVPVLEAAVPGTVGLVWDVQHTRRGYGEDHVACLDDLFGWIRHVHVKDLDPPTAEGKPVHRLPGEGLLPFPALLADLMRRGYSGWLSFEWEKRWHPALEDPSTALPRAVVNLRRLLAGQGVSIKTAGN
ncbi:hypothetical protein LBMAG53_04160 [Planctomycetota bacterium]|nr:hypothetical protein LBMAG53_04160 [Planctomycetota bacterium]